MEEDSVKVLVRHQASVVRGEAIGSGTFGGNERILNMFGH